MHTAVSNKYLMRINEDFIEDIEQEDLTTQDESRP